MNFAGLAAKKQRMWISVEEGPYEEGRVEAHVCFEWRSDRLWTELHGAAAVVVRQAGSLLGSAASGLKQLVEPSAAQQSCGGGVAQLCPRAVYHLLKRLRRSLLAAAGTPGISHCSHLGGGVRRRAFESTKSQASAESETHHGEF